jgi:CDP-diacylglycerol---glycerol-3-phosphate 3-phosphatidyltransferase
MRASSGGPAATFVATTSLTFLKLEPRLEKISRPWAGYPAQIGVTANQVTITSLIGSIVVGMLLCVFAEAPGIPFEGACNSLHPWDHPSLG